MRAARYHAPHYRAIMREARAGITARDGQSRVTAGRPASASGPLANARGKTGVPPAGRNYAGVFRGRGIAPRRFN
jgi:hypothetical protein